MYTPSEESVFSVFYSKDLTQHTDKPKFRKKALKFVEDFINLNLLNTHSYYIKGILLPLCRKQLGMDLKVNYSAIRGEDRILVEKAFTSSDDSPETSLSNILDFFSIAYDTILELKKLPGFQPSEQTILDDLAQNYIEELNIIFRDESMCYHLNEKGRVRYYPDEEFHQQIKSTLMMLDKPKYESYLISFNLVLDELYKNPNKESPIYELFKLIEIFAVTFKLKVPRRPGLDFEWVKSFIPNVIKNYLQESNYSTQDNDDISQNMEKSLSSWISISHKFRHGKVEQVNNEVPPELFNYVFSIGISNFRFLLQMDEKYNLLQTKSSSEAELQD